MESLKVKNFMAFSEEVDVKFSPKINVIIGENGTGKSQLLKLVHFSHGSLSRYQQLREEGSENGLEILTQDFIKYFLPLNDKLGKLCNYGSSAKCELNYFLSTVNVALGFSNNSQKLQLNGDIEATPNSIFVPAKEVLSFMEGFVSMYERHKVSFDKTYHDICIDFGVIPMRDEELHIKSKWAIKEIEKVCSGEFIFEGSGKVTFKATNGDEYSVNAIAEGFRKVGMLARLLKNGTINPGLVGPLLWDEPEANMNPKLLKTLVEILLELARNGQQIILTTHDYVLLKWFDLLMDKGKGDHVRYHMLFKETPETPIEIFSTDDYLEVADNSSITATYNELIHEQVRKKMGGLGK